MSEERTRKIAIVGTAEPHWRAAPFGDESWEIWTCGGLFGSVPRTDMHFELHAKEKTCIGWGGSPEEEAAARNVYWEWLGQQGARAMLRGPRPEAPDASIYPLEPVLRAFPNRYFTSTICYMLALALLEEPKALGVWGVDMALTGDPEIPESNEYARQRPSVEFYLGIAIGQGVQLHLPEGTTLLTSRRLYGFDDSEDAYLKALDAKITELKQKHQQAKAMKEQAARMEASMQTGLEIARYARRNGEF